MLDKLSTYTTLLGSLEQSTNVELLINNEILQVNDWLKANKLSVNFDKTRFMIFHSPNKTIPELNIKIENITIKIIKESNEKYIHERIQCPSWTPWNLST